MIGPYIGFGGLLGIFAVILLLFRRRQKMDKNLTEFYQKNRFYRADNLPANLIEAIGKGNWEMLQSRICTDDKSFSFYWLVDYKNSNIVINNTPMTFVYYSLAIAFPPNSVSEEFMQKAYQFKENTSKFKNFFVYNTKTPIRVEKLTDGSFLMVWQVVNRADIYRKKLEWLYENLS